MSSMPAHFVLARYGWFLFAAGAAVAVSAAPAHAIFLTQETAPVSFTIDGSQTPTTPNQTPLKFTAFNASTPGTLTGIQIKFVAHPQFGGTVMLVNTAQSGKANFSGTAGPAFVFSGPGLASMGTSTAFSLSSPGLDGGVAPLAIVHAGISGNYQGTASALVTNSSTLQNYFAGEPTIAAYYANWSVVGSPMATAASSIANATLTGQIYLNYQYIGPDPVPVPAVPVPAPLPLLGAGLAFGFSRKLRRRIGSSAACIS